MWTSFHRLKLAKMKRSSCCFRLCLILIAIGFLSTVQAQQVFKTTSASVIGYLEYLPKDYHKNSNKYPVVIFLHGKGEKGLTSTNPNVLKKEIHQVEKIGPPRYVKKGEQFPFILISPQLKSSYGDWPASYVMEVVNHVKRYLRIDESRIYLTGLSLGGGGTWTTAQEYPHIFAAIAPVCGSRNSPSKACDLVRNDVPVWAFHGDKDKVVTHLRSVNMINAINSCSPKPSPQAKITIYPGVKHNAWDKAYQTDHSVHRPNVYEWLLSHKKSGSSGAKQNKGPVANAGADKVLTLPTNSVTLTASAKDEDGKIASYKWTKKSGGEATLKNAATPSLIVSNLAEGSYTFQVVASDNDGGQDADDVIVTVKEQSNKVPVANAGSDKVLTLPTNSITLTASAKDEDGKIASYKWIKKSGAEAALKNTLTPALIVSNLSIGTYVFQVTAIDDDGGQGHDEVIVTVNANNNTNRPPVANAGSDKTLTLPANSLVLDAKGSDPDGDALAFSWNQQAGEPAIMKNASTPRVEISGLTHGQYVFRLTVKDNKGGVHTDDVQVTVQGGSSGSGAITAFAGPDQTIEVPVASITIFGSGKSTSEIVAYQWTQVTGKAVRLENTTGAQLRLVDITHEGTCAFKLWVKDSQGRTDVDHVRLYFKGNATAGSKTPSNVVHDPIEDIDTLGQASAELPGESMGQDNGLSKPVDLTSDNPDEFNDLTVNIFNGNGQRIYSGKWNPEQYRKVFREKGLYIYTVESQHRNVQSGKIYVRY